MAQKKDLTPRQHSILDYLWRRRQDETPPPSYREISDAVNLSSVGAVAYQLGQLENGGYITRDKGVARGLGMTEKALALFERVKNHITATVQIPLVGDIVASEPVHMGHDDFAVYDPEEVISLCPEMVPGRTDDLFALRVRGNSMIDAMVADGDLVVLQPVSDVRNGEMVAARLLQEQETTLKHFFKTGDQVRLEPANPLLQPFYTPADNVIVHGRVVMVVRQLH
ncbi:MAG: transcriptional repressor LexA [Candidatus Promineifilaceae bacterium]|nr:transcriptional repressor LexA [Candidatus Promineifilaceae bacterium]